MDKIKKGLGRGLSSLIGETQVEPQKNYLSIEINMKVIDISYENFDALNILRTQEIVLPDTH